MSSMSYCFEKLYEAIYRPETGHPQLAIDQDGYINNILNVVEKFENQLQSSGRSDEYQSVINKLEELRNYFSEYPNSRITKKDAYRLRVDVLKKVREWNNGTLP